MIQVRNIEKSFGTLKVLKGIDLEVKKSEVVSIMGASGAGKSTLLQILGTLSTPDSGELLIDGTDVLKLGEKSLAEFRNRRLGFVFQFHHLLPEFTALENVMIPAFIAGRSRKDAEKEAVETRLVVFGSSAIVDSGIYNGVTKNDAYMFAYAIGWMCNYEDSISISAKSLTEESLVITDGQVNLWMTVYLLIPAAIIAVGVGVTVYRRRR